MTTAVRCAIRAAFRAASTAQFSLRTCNTHARAPPPAEEPEYEIEEIPADLVDKANEIYKSVHKTDIPKDRADKMRKALSEVFGTPLVGLSITGGDAVWTSAKETAEERRLREEADQEVLEKSAIEFFLCFLVWCFDMAVGSEGGAGPMCRQYGF